MKVASIFQDYMVLQRDRAIPVWGMAQTGILVRIELPGIAAVETTARADGTWRAHLPPLSAGGPHRLVISGGGGRVEFKDVLVGEVWVCSGQSNMEWSVALSTNATAEMAAADHPGIRMLNVTKAAKLNPVTELDGKWWRCTPDAVGAFSAVGYYFARELHRQLDVPVGMINSSWGGTPAEAWVSRPGLQAEPALRQFIERFDRHLGPEGATVREAARQALAKWLASIPRDPGNQGWIQGWALPDASAAEWCTMELPQTWQHAGLDFSGVLWFRREVVIPDAWAGRELVLNLGACDKGETTYFNNEKVGALGMEDRSDAWSTFRVYPVPGRLVRPGRNLVAVRVFSNMYEGGMIGPAEVMWLATPGAAPSERMPLSGDWQYRIEHNFGKVSTDAPQVMGEDNPHTPTVLFNGMIAPLPPYGIKGAIWYQGESNAARAAEYRILLPALIRDWRRAWGEEDFSFHLVQLANYMAEQATPEESDWAELREAQRLTARRVPGTGLAVTIDIGEAADVHPKNKQEVGRRLALLAMEQDYGLAVNARSPEPRLARSDGPGVALLRFDHGGAGLSVRGSVLQGFAMAGPDRVFHWAKATIQPPDTVLLKCPQVPDPRWVRYAWADNPRCHLGNSEGLPASPFELPLPFGPWLK